MECGESKLNGQTDSHKDYSAHLWVGQSFDTKSLKYFDLHIFQFKIDIVIFGRYQTKIRVKALDLESPSPMMKLSGSTHVNPGHIRHSFPFSHRVQHIYTILY